MKEKVLEILEEICEEDVSDDLDIDLFEEGLMDSLGLAQLIVMVEEDLGIKLSLTDVDREEVKTPRMIIDYLAAKSA